MQNPNASLYPWSQKRLTYTSAHPPPFPRYGAAVNSVSSKEGDIYVMGGLINSQTVKGDLWLIEAGGNMTCYPLATTAEGPGPRVGHASLLVGNAFIVYGGDTKIDESDVLDETLYLLNTCTCDHGASQRLRANILQQQGNGRVRSRPALGPQVDMDIRSISWVPRFSSLAARSRATL